MTYAYDLASRRTSSTAGSQPAVTYTYDDANRVTGITQNGKTTSYVYDAAGRVTSITMGNGILRTHTYDAASQLTSIVYKKGTTTVGDLTYTYDSLGRIITQNGTLAKVTLPTATTAVAAYDSNNRLTSWNGGAITYDAQGNMLSANGKTYTWDVRNRLTTVVSGATTLASFSYDAMDRRSLKTSPITGNQLTRVSYDGANPVTETQGTGAATPVTTGTNLTGGLDSFITCKDGATETFPLTDHLGSVIALTDANGVIITGYTYEPYGATTQTGTASNNPHQYTGRENDNTGLYYYRARYYDPSLMRFISEDPIGLAGGVNTYGYVGGSPIAFNDPSGLSPLLIIPTVAAACYGVYKFASRTSDAISSVSEAKLMTDANNDWARGGFNGPQPYSNAQVEQARKGALADTAAATKEGATLSSGNLQRTGSILRNMRP